MNRRNVLKGMAAATVGASIIPSSSSARMPEVGLPEVENACGTFFTDAFSEEVEEEYRDDDELEGSFPDNPFEVNGEFVDFTFEPDTFEYKNFKYTGLATSQATVFDKIALGTDTFHVVDSTERLERSASLEASTFSNRGRHRYGEGRLRIREEVQDCENAFTNFQLRSNNSVSFYPGQGFEVVKGDSNTVFMARDALVSTNEPILARIDAIGPTVETANNNEITFNGAGDVTFRVVTAADQVPEMECTPVLDNECP